MIEKNVGAKKKRKNYHRIYMFSIEEVKTEEIVGSVHKTLDNSEITIFYPYPQRYDAESERKAKLVKEQEKEKQISEGRKKQEASTWDLGWSFLNPPWKAESEKVKGRSIGKFEEKIQRMKNLEKRFLLTPFKSNKERHNVRGILSNIRQSLHILNHISRFILIDFAAAEAVIPFIQERVDKVADCDRIWRENPTLDKEEEKEKTHEEQKHKPSLPLTPKGTKPIKPTFPHTPSPTATKNQQFFPVSRSANPSPKSIKRVSLLAHASNQDHSQKRRKSIGHLPEGMKDEIRKTTHLLGSGSGNPKPPLVAKSDSFEETKVMNVADDTHAHVPGLVIRPPNALNHK